MKDLIILQRGNDFIVFRVLSAECPSDTWMIEAKYVAEFDSYDDALGYLQAAASPHTP